MIFTGAAPRQSWPTPTGGDRAIRLRTFRPDIEGLRAIAVLAVVLDHSGLAVHGGYIGVDVFYVISGFLITSHLYGELSSSGGVSLTGFYARRVRRILPAATVVIVARRSIFSPCQAATCPGHRVISYVHFRHSDGAVTDDRQVEGRRR